MGNLYLNKTYSYDVTFNETSFGHLILSPNVIVITQNIQRDLITFANQEGMNILQCTIQPNKIPVTLFNLKRVCENSIIHTLSLNISSNIVYSCDFAIIGKHYNNISEVKIQGVNISQNSVKQWLGINYIDMNISANNITTIAIPSVPQTIYEQILEIFSFSINFIPTIGVNSFSDERYEISYEINFRFNSVINLQNSLQHVYKWQILHALFTGQINNFDAISFSIPLNEPITDQDKENAKQNMMEMFEDAEDDLVDQFIEIQSQQLPMVSFYIPQPKDYAEQLHFAKVPILYTGIEKEFNKILDKWFNLDENMSQTIVYFIEALDKNKGIIQRFLSATKLIESFADKYSQTYFPEEKINEIKNFIKAKLKEKYQEYENKAIKDFANALKQTNKCKLNLEGKIIKLVADNDINYLNLNNDLVKNVSEYRNTLSHSVNSTRMEDIDFNILYEGYLKLLTFGFILLWNYLEIPQPLIDCGVKILKQYQELEINNRLTIE